MVWRAPHMRRRTTPNPLSADVRSTDTTAQSTMVSAGAQSDVRGWPSEAEDLCIGLSATQFDSRVAAAPQYFQPDILVCTWPALC